MFHLNYFFVVLIAAPNDGTRPPHALNPSRASSLSPILPRTPTLGWLLYLPIDWRPSKANALTFALFFDGVWVGIPNKGTDNGKSKSGIGRLTLAHL